MTLKLAGYECRQCYGYKDNSSHTLIATIATDLVIITDDCKLVMSCGSFDMIRLHLLAKMMLVILLIFATRHGVRSQGEIIK